MDSQGKIQLENFDLVVLSVGLDAHPDAIAMGKRLGIETNPWNFVVSQPYDEIASSRPGIFTCGVYQAPKDIPETVAQALSSAAAAAAMLAEAKGTMLSQKSYPPEKDFPRKNPGLASLSVIAASISPGWWISRR